MNHNQLNANSKSNGTESEITGQIITALGGWNLNGNTPPNFPFSLQQVKHHIGSLNVILIISVIYRHLALFLYLFYVITIFLLLAITNTCNLHIINLLIFGKTLDANPTTIHSSQSGVSYFLRNGNCLKGNFKKKTTTAISNKTKKRVKTLVSFRLLAICLNGKSKTRASVSLSGW